MKEIYIFITFIKEKNKEKKAIIDFAEQKVIIFSYKKIKNIRKG